MILLNVILLLGYLVHCLSMAGVQLSHLEHILLPFHMVCFCVTTIVFSGLAADYSIAQ